MTQLHGTVITCRKQTVVMMIHHKHLNSVSTPLYTGLHQIIGDIHKFRYPLKHKLKQQIMNKYDFQSLAAVLQIITKLKHVFIGLR